MVDGQHSGRWATTARQYGRWRFVGRLRFHIKHTEILGQIQDGRVGGQIFRFHIGRRQIGTLPTVDAIEFATFQQNRIDAFQTEMMTACEQLGYGVGIVERQMTATAQDELLQFDGYDHIHVCKYEEINLLIKKTINFLIREKKSYIERSVRGYKALILQFVG